MVAIDISNWRLLAGVFAIRRPVNNPLPRRNNITMKSAAAVTPREPQFGSSYLSAQSHGL